MKKLIQNLISFFVIQGLLLLMFGVLIIAHPDIFNYLVAAFLIIVGINSLYFAYKIKVYVKNTKKIILSLRK